MRKFKLLDLFSGIGGFSLGLERSGGFETVAFCEISAPCRHLLATHWPEVPIYEDVKTLKAEALGEIDAICGGFPCQDISLAGKGAGLAGERSGLWREYARLIGELRPRFVIVENVSALLVRGFGTVVGDLAALGYDCWWDCIPASAVGAPHRRDRLWIVAYARGQQHESFGHALRREIAKGLSETYASLSNGPDCEADAQRADADSFGSHRAQEHFNRDPQFRDEQDRLPGPVGEVLAYANDQRELQPKGRVTHERRRAAHGSHAGDVALTPGVGRSPMVQPVAGRTQGKGAADTATDAGFAGGWSWWFSEPNVGRVANGVPARVDRLHGLGNAVVPQIPELIGRAIMEAEA